MDSFLQPLKEAAREKALPWKLVPCGPRKEAFRRFRKAVSNGNDVANVLLVDAERPVNQSARDHLRSGEDNWSLDFASEDAFHLMVQTMEAWIVADPETLASYYGQDFRTQDLPRAPNLETVSKADLARGLEKATERTRKGRYHKIEHASDLLKRIDASKAKNRCPHCKRLFEKLGQIIAGA